MRGALHVVATLATLPYLLLAAAFLIGGHTIGAGSLWSALDTLLAHFLWIVPWGAIGFAVVMFTVAVLGAYPPTRRLGGLLLALVAGAALALIVALHGGPLDGGQLARRILAPTDGAFVNFEGVVRNNSKGRTTRYLDYECYEAMAIRVMAKLGAEIAAAYDIGRIAMAHRLGRLEIGETSVAVVVASPHRRAAFDAALEGINRLKKTVPVWKKEYFADGEVWVEGDWDASLLRR